MQKAILYVRFSSDKQKDGDSRKRQLDAGRAYCARHGFSLEKTLIDEGKSAFTGEHLSVGELGKFLLEADNGLYSGYAFLIEEVDRLSRMGVLSTFELLARLLTGGISVHEINTGAVLRELDDLDSTDKGILTTVRSILAKDTSRKTSVRVRAARASEREQARATGLAVTAKVPAWIRAERGKKPVLIPEHAATVHRIFALAGNGLGCKRIVRKLEEESRKPFGANTAWSPEYVQKILRNRAAIGEHQPHRIEKQKRPDRQGKVREVKVRVPVGEPILDYYPAVVTPSEWQAARQAVEAKTRFRKDGRRGYGAGHFNVNSLFSPLVYDYDNKIIMLHNPGKKGKKGDYPRLESRWQSTKKQHSVRLEEFETVMLGVLPDLDWQTIAEESEPPEVKQAQAELDAVLTEIDRRTARLTDLEKLVAEGTFSKTLFETLDAEKLALGDLTSRSEKLAAGLAEARAKAAALHDPAELIEAIRSGTKPELRLRLKSEIRKRVRRIDLSFRSAEWDYYVYIHFVNGALRGVGVRGNFARWLNFGWPFLAS
jgi:DNA invertase Pin-like site-specific DNA recombinase